MLFYSNIMIHELLIISCCGTLFCGRGDRHKADEPGTLRIHKNWLVLETLVVSRCHKHMVAIFRMEYVLMSLYNANVWISLSSNHGDLSRLVPMLSNVLCLRLCETVRSAIEY